ncbi:Helix-turn-helix [Frankineae bacterium MT45]|nr:Helix-turn-helix [Frankineae bacterium MT45]
MAGTVERILGLVESSGRSRGEFAKAIGLDDSKLSKSLNGTRRFSSLDLARIADTCGVTVDWLITGESPPLAAAARTSGGSADIAIAEARRLTALRGDVAAIGYPQPWLIPARSLASGNAVAQGDALARAALRMVETAARSIAEWDLAALIEAVFGADVAVVHTREGFDGLSAYSSQAKLIVLASSQLPSRQRFTLAHELGHLLVGDDQGIHLDNDVYAASQKQDPTELRANTFASVFLMPDSVLADAVGRAGLDDATFATLCCDLMVSPSALASRLLRLRLIDAGASDRFKRLTSASAAKIAGRGEELARRCAESNQPRSPGLLLRDTYAAYEGGMATLRPYANVLGVDVEPLRRSLETADTSTDAL